jgi:hypothetical protein|tara:strand:+ start:226 stop:459 length:234 start_codon:yes stop_codon:yes gene_type:complete
MAERSGISEANLCCMDAAVKPSGMILRRFAKEIPDLSAIFTGPEIVLRLTSKIMNRPVNFDRMRSFQRDQEIQCQIL